MNAVTAGLFRWQLRFFAAKRIFAFLSGNTFLCKEQISSDVCSVCIDKWIVTKYNKIH